MKIWCQQFYRLQNRNIVLWTKKFLAVLLLWICCCCPGDESHPLSTTSHVQSVTLECHVILEDLYGRYAQLACSCKCWLRCQETQKCLKWYSLIRSVASSISFHSSELSTLKEILANTYSSCCEQLSASLFQREGNTPDFTLECSASSKIPANLSHCGIDWGHSCCLVFCSDNVNHDACSYFKPDSSIHHLSSFNQLQQQHLPTTRHEQTEEVKEKEEKRENVFHQSRQRRQSSGFLPPFRIEILETIKEIAVLQPFNLSIRLVDNNIKEVSFPSFVLFVLELINARTEV
ncbi:uncharacterized protein LOC129984942 [Argiope bruennichi]|uniref:uncharacterized protein LOC129984942 n=1 Tax=Argiope bruennichi TaxID=94029 RepID=UPI0024947946|nr:uncharacterized protein LOC129984942 [Argiope bruennichi]